jgi:hypothetical protein
MIKRLNCCNAESSHLSNGAMSCRNATMNQAQWQQWHRTTRKAITRQIILASEQDGPDNTRLVHTYCQRRTVGDSSKEPDPSRT